jgi:ATP-binding cassette subfamily C protein CydD
VAKGAVQAPDLTIEPGETVALTGPSGSGKSTLIALIGGLDRHDRGEIGLDGTALDATGADAWRAQIAWVPQAAQFLDGSLRAGLLLGAKGHPTAQDIDDALRLAAATEVVARLPQGLETVLGEMGGGVSGGEARRLMLARAALSGRKVILADEPTADLDPETAAEVIAALLTLRAQGATVIVATHDAVLAAAMDRRVSLGQAQL